MKIRLLIAMESEEDYKDRIESSSRVDLVYQMNLMRSELRGYYKSE